MPSLNRINKPELKEAVERLMSEENVALEDVKIVSTSIVPMRLQHIFRNLGKEGYVVKESIVIDGDLYLIAIKKGKKFDIAPDFEAKEPQ